ncbi:hypothetical protein FIA58_004085 [Flavobacterium jejuense]|uniref:Uncharacterized protein n=1 Tax=Flavobacterium jejuense TaxID=1544455 RepID=A0ABX0ISI8_9FLAO|nr:hypothetical protein [Flavobacterium jejuense]NHN24849.1 hypothetical protein [Flavobacterium jejuense]
MNLQPLKIPSGWTVAWNLFTQTDSTVTTIHEFSGSLLLLNSPTRLKAIEVEWKPEGDLNGAYHLQVICLLPRFNSKTNEMEYEGLWETPELEFATNKRLELVDKINELLFYLKPYKDSRIVLQPGIVDEPNETLRQELLSNGLTSELITKMLASNHKVLQGLLLEHKNIDKNTVEVLARKGASKGVRNKAKQLLQHYS